MKTNHDGEKIGISMRNDPDRPVALVAGENRWSNQSDLTRVLEPQSDVDARNGTGVAKLGDNT
jgi:hypothetical protein